MIVQLGQSDVKLLRLCYEEYIREGKEGLWLDTKSVLEPALKCDIDNASFSKSLRLLEYVGYLKPFSNVSDLGIAKTTPAGFKAYGQRFLDDYPKTYRAVALAIGEGTLDAPTIAEKLDTPKWFVERIMEVLEAEGYLLLHQFFGPREVNSTLPPFDQTFGTW